MTEKKEEKLAAWDNLIVSIWVYVHAPVCTSVRQSGCRKPISLVSAFSL